MLGKLSAIVALCILVTLTVEVDAGRRLQAKKSKKRGPNGCILTNDFCYLDCSVQCCTGCYDDSQPFAECLKCSTTTIGKPKTSSSSSTEQPTTTEVPTTSPTENPANKKSSPSPPSSPTPSTKNEKNKNANANASGSDDAGGGSIVIIIIACSVLIVGVACAFICYRKKSKKSRGNGQDTLNNSFQPIITENNIQNPGNATSSSGNCTIRSSNWGGTTRKPSQGSVIFNSTPRRSSYIPSASDDPDDFSYHPMTINPGSEKIDRISTSSSKDIKVKDARNNSTEGAFIEI